jgi:hypothetical protein
VSGQLIDGVMAFRAMWLCVLVARRWVGVGIIGAKVRWMGLHGIGLYLDYELSDVI